MSHKKAKTVASELNTDFTFEEDQEQLASWIPTAQLVEKNPMVHFALHVLNLGLNDGG